MDPAYFEKLSQYFKANGSKIDETLNHLLNALKRAIANASKTNASEVLTHTILVTAVHLSRKRAAKDLQLVGFPALLSAFEDNLNLYETLESIRDDINELNLHIPWTSNLPTRLIGFDPRYDKPDAEGNWKNLLEEITKEDRYNPVSPPKLLETHQAAKNKIYLDFYDPSTRYDLLLVDFAWLPELAYQGHVLPIDVFVPQIEDLIKDKIVEGIRKGKESKVVENWEHVLRHLASAGNGRYYAFPILLNFHAFLTRTDDIQSGRKLLYDELNSRMSAVQDAQTACCVYELYSHFAYHGAWPIQCKGSGNEFQIKLDLPIRLDNMREHKVFKAILDYLTRLKIAHSKTEPFQTDHLREVDLLEHGSKRNGFDACVSFPLELCGRLTDGLYACSEPFWQPSSTLVGESDRNFLTSLGGYGLAISRQANDYGRAAYIARQVFEKSLDMKQYGELLPIDKVRDIQRFVNYHCRPRIPFWSHIEEILSDALVRLSEIVGDNVSRIKFDVVKSELQTKLVSDKGVKTMQWLEQRLKWAFWNNGWDIKGSDG